MTFLKQTIAMALCLLMLAALAACGAQQKPAEAGPAQEPENDAAPVNEGGNDPAGGGEREQPAAPDAQILPIAVPVYPEERSFEILEKTGLDAFAAKSLPTLFAGLNGENRVFSPLNVYMALAMLAEVTEGESRAQLLETLGCADVEALRAEVRALFETSFSDEQALTVLPAASIWLRSGFPYQQEALSRLAEDYYAAAFSGPMGDEAYSQALRDWVNEKTNGLLKEQADGLSLDKDAVLALVTTLYFKGRWTDEFSPEHTVQDVFHADSGDRNVDFMRRSVSTLYYRGERFGAIRLPMHGGAWMWLVLPDGGVSLQELIDSGELGAFLSDPESTGNRQAMVRLSLPRFDVSSDLELVGVLKQLGVADVFNGMISDFSPLTDEPLYVDSVEHAARVKIDEEGCEAATFTAITVKAAGMIMDEEEVEFTCDRPFFFAVTGSQDQLLFTGAVNEPAE